jgi:type IV secretory pathway component VirB8
MKLESTREFQNKLDEDHMIKVYNRQGTAFICLIALFLTLTVALIVIA